MPTEILQYLLSGLVVGAIYALIGLGYTGIYNVTGIINFAQGDFAMLGAMVTIALAAAGLPLLVAVVLAVLFVTAVGAAIELGAIRPARADPISGIIITIGAGVFLQGAAQFAWGTDARPLDPFSGYEVIDVFGAALPMQGLWVLGTGLALMALLQLFFSRTFVGKAFRACAMNRYAAGLVGIQVRAMSLLSFVISASLGAIAGIIVAPIVLARFDIGVPLGLKGFVAAMIGGLGNSIGAVIGGFVLGVLESMAAGLLSSGYKNAIAFVLMLLVLFLRPGGLLGSYDQEAE